MLNSASLYQLRRRKQLRQIPFVLLAFFTLTLSGCIDTNGSDLATDQWVIKSGVLNHADIPLDWQSNIIESCQACEIKTEKVFHPSGPVVIKQLLYANQIIAIKGETIDPWIDFIGPPNKQRIPLQFDQKERKVYLSLSGEAVLLVSNKIIAFELNKQNYQLWVDKIEFKQQQAQLANEQAKVRVHFLLLAIPS